MIHRSEWADPDRDRIYDLSEIIEILDYEIKLDSSLRSSTFKNLYNSFKKCALWIEDANYAREDIDLNKVIKSSGVDSFDRLHTAFCEYLQYQSYIKDIDQLIIDLNYYYDDFRSLNYEIEYN
jgi:hypothetical protein